MAASLGRRLSSSGRRAAGIVLTCVTLLSLAGRCSAGTRTERVFYVTNTTTVKGKETTYDVAGEPTEKPQVITTIHHMAPGQVVKEDHDGFDVLKDVEKVLASTGSPETVGAPKKEQQQFEPYSRSEAQDDGGGSEGDDAAPAVGRRKEPSGKGEGQKSKRKGKRRQQQQQQEEASEAALEDIKGYDSGGWSGLSRETKVEVLERCATNLAKLQVKVFLALQKERRKLEREKLRQRG